MARQLGKANSQELSELQKKYKDKVKQKLEEVRIRLSLEEEGKDGMIPVFCLGKHVLWRDSHSSPFPPHASNRPCCCSLIARDGWPMQRAEELQRERKARAVQFEAGKSAYARGRYPSSVELLEKALNEEGPFSQLGGEIQLWLALAYEVGMCVCGEGYG